MNRLDNGGERTVGTILTGKLSLSHICKEIWKTMTESTTNGEHLALWGGRFKSGPSPELARLSKSTQFDWRLADDDIAGSRAHARALGRAGLLTADELQRMEDALDELQRRVDSGAFAPIEDDEDEATALERGLLQIAGDELGGKLRAGRSRNDQIAALIRMWLRRHSRIIAKMLLGLAATLIEQSEKPVAPSCRDVRICSTPNRFCLPTSS